MDNGKIVVKQSLKYYTRLVDENGIKRTIALYTDKTASLNRAIQLKIEFEQASEGLIDRYREDRKKPVREHIEDFRASLKAKGNTDAYVKLKVSRAKKIVDGCKFFVWSDIRADRVQQFLADLRDNGNGISNQTSNFYLQAIQQFCRWMKQNQRAGELPLDHLKGLNVRVDRRHDRRALEPDEIRRLLEATRASETRFGMSGHHRALCYRLSIESGLRASELRSLTVSSFDFDNHTVTVKAGYSKRKREDVLPLRPDTAKQLSEFAAGKMPTVHLFPLPEKAVKMLRADLAKTKIEYKDDSGRFVDFHSLRHTTGSLLAASGVHPKVAQAIMRHSDINLTLSRYSHIFRGQESEAVAALPDLSAPSSKQKNAATGTDGKPVDAVGSTPKELTRKWTPYLTQPTYSGCNRLSMNGNAQSELGQKLLNDKSLNGGELGSESDKLSSVVNDKKQLRPAGLEPTTPGLGNRCSILLSYGRFNF